MHQKKILKNRFKNEDVDIDKFERKTTHSFCINQEWYNDDGRLYTKREVDKMEHETIYYI